MLRDPWNGGPYPLAINVNAKILGLVVAIINGFFLLLGLLALPVLFGASVALGSLGIHGVFALGVLGLLVGLVAAVLVVIGGLRMYQGNASGKDLVLLALVIRFVADLVYGFGYATITGSLISLILTAVFWYLVIVSRFPGEAPVAGTSAPPPPPPPPSYSDYTPPPPPPPAPPAGGES